MLRLCINTRDEVVLISLEDIAFLQADGNYTRIMYIEGQQISVSLGLSKMEELIQQTFPKDRTSPFVRLGRSLIINQNFLYYINMLKLKLVLSDRKNHSYSLNIPKNILKAYRILLDKKV